MYNMVLKGSSHCHCNTLRTLFIFIGAVLVLLNSHICQCHLMNATVESLQNNYDLQVFNPKSATYTVFTETDFSPYTRWSRWSKCSRKCLTRRFRRCKYKDICGDKILRQRAYCFPRSAGNFCERWFSEQNMVPEISPINSKSNRRIQHLRSNQIEFHNKLTNETPEYTAQHINCGHPLGKRSGTKTIYDMLKIMGGRTARRYKWPWQVAILNRHKEAFCGGTLITPQWVITAAHCVRRKMYVRLGEYDLEVEEEDEVEYHVKRIIIHPKYDEKESFDNDIALLMLPEMVEQSKHAAFACLPQSFQSLPDSSCTIIGWGKMSNNDEDGSDILKEAEVPIVSMYECRNQYKDSSITKNMFCAGHRHGRIDTCSGDSGGPLLCRDTTKSHQPWTIFGITSFGDGCGKKNKYGIYSRLPNYIDWIWSVINCNGNCTPRKLQFMQRRKARHRTQSHLNVQ